MDDTLARIALVIAMLTFVFAAVWTLMLNAEIEELKNNRAEIGTALTCEQVSGVVVCVEN